MVRRWCVLGEMRGEGRKEGEVRVEEDRSDEKEGFEGQENRRIEGRIR